MLTDTLRVLYHIEGHDYKGSLTTKHNCFKYEDVN